jgi:signal transduction histidine kinase
MSVTSSDYYTLMFLFQIKREGPEMDDMQHGNLIYIDERVLHEPYDFTPSEREVLGRINQKVAGGKTLSEILDFLFIEIGKIIPCDRLDVSFVEEEGRRLVLQYVKTTYDEILLKKGFTSDIHGSPIQKVFLNGHPSIITDMKIYSHERPYSESARLLHQEGIESSMTCPLIVEERPVGLLLCRSRKKNAYSVHEIRLQMAFAERLGQAVEKSYRIDQLTSAMQSYMEMLGFVSHEIKNLLASIITLGKTMASGYFGDISIEHKNIIERIIKKAEYLHNLSSEYLNLASFESGRLEINPGVADFIKDIVTPSIELVAPMIEESRIQFINEIPKMIPPVKCDPALIKIVMINLLGNAVKYGKTGGTVKLTINVIEEFIHVSVWNEGPGFPDSEKMRLFKKFSKIHTPELMEKKGHGVGLYVTWQIIQLHGGKIWAESEHGKWAEFTFEMPLNLDFCMLDSSTNSPSVE